MTNTFKNILVFVVCSEAPRRDGFPTGDPAVKVLIERSSETGFDGPLRFWEPVLLKDDKAYAPFGH